MDGWKIPNQKWMITGGTHGYPYDLGNPHNLPYIIIFHIYIPLTGWAQNPLIPLWKSIRENLPRHGKGRVQIPTCFDQQTATAHAVAIGSAWATAMPASMLKSEGNLDGISMNVVHSHGKWSISFDLPICEITRMVRVAFNFLWTPVRCSKTNLGRKSPLKGVITSKKKIHEHWDIIRYGFILRWGDSAPQGIMSFGLPKCRELLDVRIG